MALTDMKKTIEELNEKLQASKEEVRQMSALKDMAEAEVKAITKNMDAQIEAAVNKAKSDVCLQMFDTYRQGQNDGLEMIERAQKFCKFPPSMGSA